MLVYYFVPFIVSNHYLLFWVSNSHNSVTVHNRTHVYMNFFDHKDLGNHLPQLCPKVVKHRVCVNKDVSPDGVGVVGWLVSTEFEMLWNAATVCCFEVPCHMWSVALTRSLMMAGVRTEIWTQDLVNAALNLRIVACIVRPSVCWWSQRRRMCTCVTQA